jgi:hypothetical protein
MMGECVQSGELLDIVLHPIRSEVVSNGQQDRRTESDSEPPRPSRWIATAGVLFLFGLYGLVSDLVTPKTGITFWIVFTLCAAAWWLKLSRSR